MLRNLVSNANQTKLSSSATTTWHQLPIHEQRKTMKLTMQTLVCKVSSNSPKIQLIFKNGSSIMKNRTIEATMSHRSTSWAQQGRAVITHNLPAVKISTCSKCTALREEVLSAVANSVWWTHQQVWCKLDEPKTVLIFGAAKWMGKWLHTYSSNIWEINRCRISASTDHLWEVLSRPEESTEFSPQRQWWLGIQAACTKRPTSWTSKCNNS